MKGSTSSKNLYFILGIILLILSWQSFSIYVGSGRMVFPGPGASFRCAFELLTREYTWKCILATMIKMLKGFSIALLIGLILGTIAGNFPFFEQMLRPFIITLRAVPTASLVYLFIVLAGFRNAPVCLVTLIGFPIIYEGVLSGIRNIPESIVRAMKADGTPFLRGNLRIRLPLALPYIYAALAAGFSLCFKIEIMAEVITGASDAGLGSVIAGVRASDPTDMVPVFGYSLIAVALMLLIDRLCNIVKSKSSI